MSARPQKSRLRALLWTLGAILAAAAVCFAYLAWQVWSQAAHDEAQPAAVIVVFGAAEYRGRPSPVLRGRLEHALDLYRRKLAPRILTTGGPGGDPHFTEGGVGRNFLVTEGVPPEHVIVEEESTSTAETVVAVAEIMQRNAMRTCIAVSDGYHLFRIKQQLQSKGIRAFGSPRETRREMPLREQVRVTINQVAGYILWRLGIRY